MTTLRKLCTDTRPLSHHSSTEAHVKANESGSRLTLEEGEYSACLGGHPALSRPHREVLAAFLGLSRVPGDPELVAGEDGPGYLITPGDTASPGHHVAPRDVLGALIESGPATVVPRPFSGEPKPVDPLESTIYHTDPYYTEKRSMGVESTKNDGAMLGDIICLSPGDTLKLAYELLARLKAAGLSLNEADYTDDGQPLTQPQ